MRQRYGKKMLTVMVLGAFLILGLSSLGLAQEDVGRLENV